jgi:replicative DNA helicase
MSNTSQQILIGSILVSGIHWKNAFEDTNLDSNYFPDPKDKKIWEELEKSAQRNQEGLDINVISKNTGLTIKEVLFYSSKGSLSSSHLETAKEIKKEYLQNNAKEICQNAFLELTKPDCIPQDVISKVLQNLENIQKIKSGKVQKVIEIISERAEYVEKAKENLQNGIQEAGSFGSFGIQKLDNFLGKYSKFGGGDLITIAAMSGAGKTTLGIQTICELQKIGKKGLIINLEMSKFTLSNKIVSILSGVPLDTVEELQKVKPDMSTIDQICQKKFDEYLAKIIDIDIHITDGVSNFDEIVNTIKNYKRKYGVDYVMIDYIQLVQSSNYKSENGSYSRIGEMTKSLKLLARQLDTVIIQLSQLSKDGSVAESQKIIHDSDLVLFLERANETKIIVKKDRKRGVQGSIEVGFNSQTQTFF